MIGRRTFLGGLATAAASVYPQPRRPNLLFMIADDHAGYVLGAAGNRQARTPNLDRLAAEGTRFARHFCNSPVCTPSRQSLLTGQLPHSAGVTRLPTPLAEDKPTLAKQLRDAGYSTGVFGKMHFNRPGVSGLHGFEICRTEREIQQEWNKRPFKPLPEGTATQKLPWQPFRTPARQWLNAAKLPYPRYEADMKSSHVAALAGQFLEQHRERPFALWVSFTEPHSPFDFPAEDAAAIEPANLPPPRVGSEDAWQVPLIFRDLTDSEKRGIAASYYTAVGFLDRNVGRVLAQLRSLGLDRDTLVVYTADHGYCLGHHGRFEKHCGYDPALHVPLALRWPGHVRAGQTVQHLTEHVDLTATLIELLGLPPLPVKHGQSLWRPRGHVFSEYLENEEAFIRTGRWKFIFCSGRRERGDGYKTDNPTPGRYLRLYDVKADPGEFTDVAAKNPAVVKRMKELMLARFRATHPEAGPKGLGVEEAIEWYLRPRDA